MPNRFDDYWQRLRLIVDKGLICANRSDTSTRNAPSSQISELEPRILFSASPIDPSLIGESDQAMMVSPVDTDQQAESSETTAETIQQAQSTRDIIVIDSQVPELQQLLDDIANSGRDSEVFVLDANQDGVDQISAILESRTDIESIHIVSHAENGSVRLGNTWLGESNLAGYAGQIASWQSSLTSGADILLYGCDLASDSSGQAFIDSMSALTGADVAASVDGTGHANYDGDWDLEYTTGVIETQVAFSNDLQASWTHKLSTITVNTFADEIAADGFTSLREAINDATAGDTIMLASGTYFLDETSGASDELFGDLDIFQDVTIIGTGAGSTIIDAGDIDRVIQVSSGTATIQGLTIQNGNAGAGAGLKLNSGATANLTNVDVLSNSGSDGGGINSLGTLTLTDVTIDGNDATWGGGLFLGGGSATLERVTISGNESTNNGGGIYNFFTSSLSLVNVTISDNESTANSGGGIWTKTAIAATNVTIVHNSSLAGGAGIHANGAGDVTLTNSILHNPLGLNSNQTLSSGGFNIDSDGTAGLAGTGEISGADPLLGVLRDNGGSTLTHALLAGSAGINTGTSTGAPTTDQTGATRGDNVDIGAIAFQLSGNLWFSTEQNGGDNDGTSWQSDDVLQLSNPDLAFETTSATSDGTITKPYVDFDGVTADANVRALHYVTTDITVGTGSQVALLAGDILVSFRQDVDLVIENDGQTLQTVTNKSLLAYRASEDKWYMVLEEPIVDGSARNIHAITLVEHDTFVGSTSTLLSRGDFLISYSGAAPAVHQNVYWYQTANTGPGSTDSMTGTLLLDGTDLGIPTSAHVQGLEFAETNITMQDGTVVSAGAIMMTLSQDATVAGTATKLEDVFYVMVSQTEVEGSSTTATVMMLLEGNDIGLDSAGTNEMINALAVAPNHVPTDISPNSFTVNENIDTTSGYSVGTLSASDLDSGDTFTYSIVGGADQANFSVVGDQLMLDDGLLDFETKASYSVTVRVSDSGSNTYDETLSVSVNDQAEITNADEFLVNETTGDQQITSAEDRGSQRAISMAADGSYAVVWTSLNQDGSGQGVYAQRFDATGARISLEVPVNVTPTNDQQWARVASAADGTFVVTWTSNQGANQDVYYRRFNADGTSATGELIASTTTAGTQKNSVIAMDAAGGFVIAWQGNGDQVGNVDGSGIFAQRFDAAGAAIGGEFRVNTATSGTQYDTAIDVNDNGDFVVVWDDANGVHFQRFDNTGAKQGSQIPVDGSNFAGNAAVAVHDDGSFVVTWREGFSNRDIYARRFSDSGAPLTAILTVNTTTTNDQTDPSISMDAEGNFIIVWEGEGAGDNAGVFAQKFTTLGVTSGSNFLVNQTTNGTQSKASVALGDTENFVVVWSGNGDQTDQVDTSGVFARQFGTAVNEAPTLTATGSDPTFAEDGAAVTLFTAATADTIEPNQTFNELTLTVTNVSNDADEIINFDTFDIELENANTGTMGSGLGYSVSVTGGTATVTISGGNLTATELETLVESMTYQNDNDDADLTNRVVTLTAIKDSGGTAGGGNDTATLSISSTVSLTGENDRPTLTGGPYSLTGTNEDTTSTGTQVSTILAGLTAADEDGDTLGVAITVATGNGTWQYSVNSTDGSDGVWTGFPNVDSDTALLLSDTSWIRYAPDTISGETANITFNAWDGSTGTASIAGTPSLGDTEGGGSTSAFSNLDAQANLVVSDLNDAPVLADANPTLGDIDEDDFTNDGDLVRNVVVNGSITDVDGSPVESIAVTAVDNTNGVWQYSTDDGGTWNVIDDGALAADHALLLDGTLTGGSLHRLRFVPTAGFDGVATLTFRAWDQSTGSTDTYSDTTIGTAFSSATDTASITVNPIDFAVTARETVDSDANGQIDYIKITTSENLNDDFSDLTITVTGYTLDVTTPYVTNIGAGGVNDNVFYVMLQESGTPDTGATPSVEILANTALGQFGGGGNLAVDASGVTATDKAGAVLISATSTQVIGTTIFQTNGDTLDFVFSETLSGLPSELDLEAALAFAAGASDADNLPSIGSGSNPLSFVTTTLANDTIRVELSANNTVNANGLLVGTHSAQVNDGTNLTDLAGNTANTSAAATIVGELNDEPTLSATSGSSTFTENDASPATLFSGASASTIEAGQTFAELTLTVTNVSDGSNEILGADGSSIGLINAAAGLTANNGLSYSVSISGSTATVSLTGGTLNATALETIVNTLTYQNDSENPETSDRVVTLTTLKDSGGTAGGGDDTSAPGITSTVTVDALNDAPTLSGGPFNLTGTNEDTTSVGEQVSDILVGLTGGDVDGDTLGLAVTTAIGNGTWQYSIDSTDGSDGAWTNFGTVASNSALLLSETSWVRYQPDTQNGETASLTFHAWDGSSGIASIAGTPSVADPDGGGETKAFSSGTAQATLVVSDVNDAPTGTNLTTTSNYNEGDSAVAIANIVVTDIDTAESITATLTLADTSTGSLSANDGASYNGVSGVWTINGTVANVNIALANLAFTPNVDNELDTSISVVIDDGDEDGGGPLTGTITLDVTPQNDAPTATNLTTTSTYNEGDNTVAITNIVVTDIDSAETITATLTLADTSTGSLTANDGATYNAISGVWTINNSVANVNIALANLAFTPVANNEQDTTINVVIDDGDEDGSGPLTGTITLDVTAQNDPATVTLTSIIGVLPENVDTTTSTLVATVLVSDDGMGTNVLALAGADRLLFELQAGGTELHLKAGVVLDFETNPTLDVIVAVDDSSIPGAPDGFDTHSITVGDVNDAPTFPNLNRNLFSGSTLRIGLPQFNFLGNDADGDSLVPVIVSGASEGTVFVNASGTIVYRPRAGFVGIDSFQVVAFDGLRNSDPATITVTVIAPIVTTPPVDPPSPDDPGDENNPAEEVDGDDGGVVGGGGGELSGSDDDDESDSEKPIGAPSVSGPTLSSNDDDNEQTTKQVLPEFLERSYSEPSFNFVRQFTSDASDGDAGERIRRAIVEGILDSVVTMDYALFAEQGEIWNELDQKLDQVESKLSGDLTAVHAAGAAASSFTVAVVAWTIRSGLWATSFLAQMPAWRAVDPLMIMQGGGDDDDETLEELMQRETESLDEEQSRTKQSTGI